jgi:uncharacterized protein (TIGR02453 family)
MHLRDLTQFLSELTDNNNRPWFVMNKPRYDILREEFLALVTQLVAATSRFDPQVAACNPKKALFRIHRDMRFSHDKSPYKTQFSASIRPDGRKKPSDGGGPSYYFQIDGSGQLFFAAGEYAPPADRLRAIRQHVIADAAGFNKALRNKALKSTFGSLYEENKLSRPPKGFDADEPMIEYLKLKHFLICSDVQITARTSPDLAPQLAEAFKNAYPLVQWLRSVPASAEAP